MPPSLGQKLKQAREQMGLGLPDVSHKTRIPVARLQDLEDDNYNTFGSLTYARSFLQTYATHVGVDAHTVTDHLVPTPLGGARNYRYLTQSLGRWIGFGLEGDRSLMPEARPVRSSRLAAVLVAVAGAVLVGGVLWAKALFNDRKPQAADIRAAARHDGSKDPASDEEIRPAVPNRSPGDNVPIRKALPVNDDPKSKAKK